MPRSRLVTAIHGLLADYRLIFVTATAGAGKTSAIREAMGSIDCPVAWLTLDASDRAPGRLLTYLEAAWQRAVSDLAPVVSESLAAGISHEEVAGLLAEALGDERRVLVVDEVERIGDAPAARAVLESFVRYASRDLRVILLSRQNVPLDTRSPYELEIAHLGEEHLAFTVAEARDVLDELGRPGDDAEAVVRATGGWITGIRFEAWRSADHVPGVGGGADPLRGYLSNEIMAQLDEREQAFLIQTALLDEVRPARAEALGLVEAGVILDGLRDRHLPVEFDDAGLVMRCHPRFRDYLHDTLERLEQVQVRSLRRAHGQLLAAEGRQEEAVAELLRAGAVVAAAEVAEHIIMDVIRRLDFDLAQSWLHSFSRRQIDDSWTLSFAELHIALEHEEYGRGTSCADRLRAMAGGDDVTTLPADFASMAAWCYFLVGRIDDALGVLDQAQESPETRVTRFVIRGELISDETHYRDRPPETGEPIDGLLARADLAHGRFQRILNVEWRPWAAVRSSQIGALAALGRTDEALALFEQLDLDDWTSVRLYGELMAALDEPEGAWEALNLHRDRLARSGSDLYRMFALLLEVELLLRFDQDTTRAAQRLSEVEREPTARLRIRIIEQLEMWRGLIHLLEHDDEEARRHLRCAVDCMTTWDRLLNLPAAAVYLAEAEWRSDEADAADVAADIALEAAQRQGSHHLLLKALREFPAVVSRRLDAVEDVDSVWHELGRIVMRDGGQLHTALHARVRVIEFGDAHLIIDGRPLRPKLAKSLELLAMLAAEGNQLSRDAAIESLFDSKSTDAAKSYFRMALNGLRQLLPEDAPLTFDSDVVRWTGDTLTSQSVELEVQLRRGAHLPHREQLATAEHMIDVLGTGEYLPQSRSEWTIRRRDLLQVLSVEVHELGARSAYHLGEYRKADQFVKAALRLDPLREGAWRLAMKIASALGDNDEVISRFQSCREALVDLGTEPSSGTRRLLEDLRR